MAIGNSNDLTHIVRTSDQWKNTYDKYELIPVGVLCVELVSSDVTKIKIGDGHNIFSKLPYIGDLDLSKYYTKLETDTRIKEILTQEKVVRIKGIIGSKSDLPADARCGDIYFVRQLSSSDNKYIEYIYSPDNTWEPLGGIPVDIDLSEYAKTAYVDDKIEQVNERIDDIEQHGTHTHPNKEILDQITEPYTTADKETLVSLHNYDDTEIREMISQSSHTHSNKDILDATSAAFTREDKSKLDQLNPYDDSTIKERITELERVAHEHSNKRILDQTTASFTKEYERKMRWIRLYTGCTGMEEGIAGLVPAAQAGEEDYVLSGSGEWVPQTGGGGTYELPIASATVLGGIKVGDGLEIDANGKLSVVGGGGGGDSIAEGDGITITTDPQTGVKTISVNTGDHLEVDENTGELNVTDVDYTAGKGIYIGTDYKNVEYIKNGGNYDQVILTDIIPDSSDKLEMDIKFGAVSNLSTNKAFIGCANYGSGVVEKYGYTIWCSLTSSNSNLGFYNKFIWTDGMPSSNMLDHAAGIDYTGTNSVRTILTMQGATASWGETTLSFSDCIDNTFIEVTEPIALFGQIDKNDVIPYDCGEITLYGVKWYDSNDTLLHNLVPVKRLSDNTGGLYDTITQKFYGNSGGGSFVIGPETTTPDRIINAKIGNGLQFDSNNAIEVNTGDGLSINQDNELEVNIGTGLEIDPQTGAINVTSGGDTVEAGDGIDITTDSQTGNKVISIDTGNGLQINQDGELEIDPSIIPDVPQYYPGKAIDITASSDSNLPAGYAEVDYIEALGDSYTIIDYIPNRNTKIVGTAMMMETSTDPVVFGARTSNNGQQFVFWFNRYSSTQATVGFVYGTNTWSTTTDADGGKLIPYVVGDQFTFLLSLEDEFNVNGEFVHNITENGAPASNIKLGIFALTISDTSIESSNNIFKGRMYEFKIYENDELVVNLVPAIYISTGSVGFYDTIGDTFYTSRTSTPFICDPSTAHVSGYLVDVKYNKGLNVNQSNELEVVLSDGLQFDSTASETLVADKLYLFNSRVTCQVHTDSPFTGFPPNRTYQKTTIEPALCCLWEVGGADLMWTGPLIVGLTETSVQYTTQDTSQTVNYQNTFTYLGKTWYTSGYPDFLNDADHEDKLGHLQYLGSYSTTADQIQAAKDLIDLANVRFVSNAGIQAKLGNGLSFDANGAIQADAQPLSPATDSTLGGVIVGEGINVDEYGEISLSAGEGLDIDFESHIPSEYTLIKGISSVGHNDLPYINTGYLIKPTSRIVMRGVLYKTTSGWAFPIGVRHNNYSNPVMFCTHHDSNGDSIELWLPNDTLIASATDREKCYNDPVTVTISSDGLNIENETTGEVVTLITSDTLPTASLPLYIFATNDNYTISFPGSMDLYRLQIFEGTTKVLDYLPCKRNSDNKYGVYDIVANEYKASSNAALFEPVTGTPSGDDLIQQIKLLPATENTIGGVIVGDGILVDNDGTISVDPTIIPEVTDYRAGDAIEIKHSEYHLSLTDYSNNDFIASIILSVTNGTISKAADNSSFVLSSSFDDCYTRGSNYGSNGSYPYTVKPLTQYRLQWDSASPGITGYTMIFENGEYTYVHVGDQGTVSYIDFTTAETTTFIQVRFGIAYAGNSISISNIRLYEYVEDPFEYEEINVKYNKGLIVNQDNELEVNLGSGLSFNQNGEIEADQYTLPTASSSTLGGVKVGTGLSIESDGTLSVVGGGSSGGGPEYAEGDAIEIDTQPLSFNVDVIRWDISDIKSIYQQAGPYIQMRSVEFCDSSNVAHTLDSGSAIWSDGDTVSYASVSETIDELVADTGKLCAIWRYPNHVLKLTFNLDTVTPLSDIVKFRMKTANDTSERDPKAWKIYVRNATTQEWYLVHEISDAEITGTRDTWSNYYAFTPVTETSINVKYGDGLSVNQDNELEVKAGSRLKIEADGSVNAKGYLEGEGISIDTTDYLLPTGYTRIKALSSTLNGNQYINTGYKLNSDTTIDMKCTLYKRETSVWAIPLGARIYNNYGVGGMLFVTTNSDNLVPSTGVDTPSLWIESSLNYPPSGQINLWYNDIIDLHFDNHSVTCENQRTLEQSVITSQTAITATSNYDLYVFATNNGNNADYFGKMDLYELTISENNTIIHRYIPCKRDSDDKYGLYDIIDDEFKLSPNNNLFSYVPGLPIDDIDETISLLPATTTTLGGIKIGDGLAIDEDGVVSTTNIEYEAGQGIEFITTEDGFNVKNKEYYFTDTVSCRIDGNYGPRTFTRLSDEPCLMALMKYNTSWCMPIIIGLTAESVDLSQSYDSTILHSKGTVDYKGYTWYVNADYGLTNGSMVDLMGNIQTLPDMYTYNTSSYDDYIAKIMDAARDLIDAAELIQTIVSMDVWNGGTGWTNGDYTSGNSDTFTTSWPYTYHYDPTAYIPVPEGALKMRVIGISNENDSHFEGGGANTFDANHHHTHWVDCCTATDEWRDIPEGTVYVQPEVKWSNGNTRTISSSDIKSVTLQFWYSDPKNNAITAKLGNGLEFDQDDAIQVKLGDGLVFDEDGAIQVTGGGGGSGDTVAEGAGIEITTDQQTGNKVIAVNAGTGLQVDQTTNELEIDDSVVTEDDELSLVFVPDDYQPS